MRADSASTSACKCLMILFFMKNEDRASVATRNYKGGTRLSSAMKNWPLWSLFAVALSLSVVLAVPDFRRVVVSSGAIALTCAVVVAWIFVLTRAIEPTLNMVSRYVS